MEKSLIAYCLASSSSAQLSWQRTIGESNQVAEAITGNIVNESVSTRRKVDLLNLAAPLQNIDDLSIDRVIGYAIIGCNVPTKFFGPVTWAGKILGNSVCTQCSPAKATLVRVKSMQRQGRATGESADKIRPLRPWHEQF